MSHPSSPRAARRYERPKSKASAKERRRRARREAQLDVHEQYELDAGAAEHKFTTAYAACADVPHARPIPPSVSADGVERDTAQDSLAANGAGQGHACYAAMPRLSENAEMEELRHRVKFEEKIARAEANTAAGRPNLTRQARALAVANQVRGDYQVALELARQIYSA